MIIPDQIIGAVNIVNMEETDTGIVIHIDMEDTVLRRTIRYTLIAPKSYSQWTATQKDTWIRDILMRRVQGMLDDEFDRVIRAFKAGSNPLRDAQGNKKGTLHMAYSEIVPKVYNYFANSTEPKDRIIAANLVQSLTDAELMNITGLDAAGIQAIRDKAAAALLAAQYMQQAGGSW